MTAKQLKKLGVPAVLIAGLLAASALGWKTGTFDKIKNYYELKALFPSSGYVAQVEDGDTFTLKTGQRIRLLGINTPERGQKNFDLARINLTSMVDGKKVFLEYDRYQDDKYARVLAWVWVGCESTPRFEPADYMHKSGNDSMPGLVDNPNGCKKGKLVNEELVRWHLATIVSYTDRGPLKYETRLKSLKSP